MPVNEKNAPGRFSKRVGKILLRVLLCVLGILLLLEIGLRIYDISKPKATSKSPTPDYSYELVGLAYFQRVSRAQGWIKLHYIPFLTYKNLPNQHNELYNINSLGLRGKEVTPAKEENVYRVIMTGNSATFGVGASNDQGTLPYLLEQELNSRGAFSKRVEVINAGVIGYLTVQELLYLEIELIDLRPDLIIAYNGHNDFFTPAAKTAGCTTALEDLKESEYPKFYLEMEQSLIEHMYEPERSLSQRAKGILTLLLNRISLFRFLSKRVWAGALLAQPPSDSVYAANRDRQIENFNNALDPECVERITARYRLNLDKISQLAIASGVQLLLVVQPELDWKQERSPEEMESRRKARADFPWYEKAFTVIYPNFLKAGQSVAAANGVGFLDLTSVFDPYLETGFVDHIHLNDAGNARVAQAIADYLVGEEKAIQR